MAGLGDLKLDFGNTPTAAASATLKPVTGTGAPTAPITKPAVTTAVAKPQVKAGGAGAGTGGSSGGAVAPTGGYSVDQARNDAAAKEAQLKSEREGQIRDNIGSSYQPIFDELDRQLGLVGGQKAELEGQVSNLAGQQVQDVAFDKEQRGKEIEGFRADENSRAKSSFQDLGDNIRNLLQASSFYLGAKGAGDSSATQGASEAISQVANKTKGKLLGVRDDALRQLDQKTIQISDLASQQTKKIDDWKNNQLFSVSQWAADRINTLNGQKASATGEKARAIAQLIDNTQQQYVDRLRQLDDNVTQYKQSVDLWQQQRQAALEDYKTQSATAASYSSGTAPRYSDIKDSFGSTIGKFNENTGEQVPITLSGVGNTSAAQQSQPKSLLDYFLPQQQQPTQLQY